MFETRISTRREQLVRRKENGAALFDGVNCCTFTGSERLDHKTLRRPPVFVDVMDYSSRVVSVTCRTSENDACNSSYAHQVTPPNTTSLGVQSMRIFSPSKQRQKAEVRPPTSEVFLVNFPRLQRGTRARSRALSMSQRCLGCVGLHHAKPTSRTYKRGTE